LFDHGGAESAAGELGVPFLGEIPLNVNIRIHGDGGCPEKLFTNTPDYVTQAIHQVVSNTAGQIAVRNRMREAAPTAVE
jgi:ATP-binding protein involved in chromosome partitioning